MTLKKFADKYEIPYHVVYSASYMVKPLTGEIYDREYEEKDLKKALRKLTVRRIQKNMIYIKNQKRILEKLKEE